MKLISVTVFIYGIVKQLDMDMPMCMRRSLETHMTTI